MPKQRKTRARPVARRVYSFEQGAADGHRGMKELLGGKGANLAEMCNLGLPVPPGFTISTEVCSAYYEHGKRFPAGLEQEVERALARLERATGKGFGSRDNPLLVSVRSGARVSMPGMMDTVLNLGLNDATAAALAKRSGNPRFAFDAYRRFVQMYGDVVLGIKPASSMERDPFDVVLDELELARGSQHGKGLSADDFAGLVAAFKAIVRERTGRPFPEDPREQLWGAIGAVFGSWQNERAIAYRALNNIPSSWGTAVNIVAMVFGNLGASSGTGVAFTRDPSTGEKRFYGEYLIDAQGEDVVAGLRTPQPIATLEKALPKAWKELLAIQARLERHYRDMQDIEFTIEDGKLYMLQCRTGKRTGFAAVRIAVEMVREKRISSDEALLRIDPDSLNQLLQPVFVPAELAAARGAGRRLTRGLNAGPGAASGRIVYSARDAEHRAAAGERVVLVRIETSPEDIRGMQAAVGILTSRGGMTSHAALVARQMGKVCVAGAGELDIHYGDRVVAVDGQRLHEGDWISLDGSNGDVYAGQIATQPSPVAAALLLDDKAAQRSPLYKSFAQILAWADRARTLRVRTNADQPDQCTVAVAFGAEGIGLCRTEHMFFEGDKITPMREMILSESTAERERAL
ncbi:MAG: pyruvate, phosphate dikinase, partial [Planctomycetota bacterium]